MSKDGYSWFLQKELIFEFDLNIFLFLFLVENQFYGMLTRSI